MTRNRRPPSNRPSKSRKLSRIRAPIIGAPADFHSAAGSRIGNSGQKLAAHRVSQKRPLSHNLALALLRIQFNAMNLTIRPRRAAAYGFILTGSKLAIGRPPFFLTLIDSL